MPGRENKHKTMGWGYRNQPASGLGITGECSCMAARGKGEAAAGRWGR